MLLALYVSATTLFGSLLLLLYLNRTLPIFLHTVSGWLIGSNLTGIFIFAYTYFWELTSRFVFMVMLFQFTVSFIIFIYARKSEKVDLSFVLEPFPSLYLTLATLSLVILLSCRKIYSNFPEKIPFFGKGIIAYEHAMMASFWKGTNLRRRYFFRLENPLLYNSTTNINPFYISYMASQDVLCSNYVEISTAISFINTVSVVVGLFYLSSQYINLSFFYITLVLFNGGWGFFRCLSNNNDTDDLVRKTGRGYYTPFYQIFVEFLLFDKGASFSLALSILAQYFIYPSPYNSLKSNALGGFLIMLNPSFTCSISLFLIAFCNLKSLFACLPFVLSIPFKYYFIKISNFPIWREYQMHGIFFSPAIVVFDIFGPFSFYIFLFLFNRLDSEFLHKTISIFLVIIVASLFRVGGSSRDNSIALASVVFPTLVMGLHSLTETSVSKIKGSKIKGAITSLVVFLMLISYMGSFISIGRQVRLFTDGYSNIQSYELDAWANKVPPNATVMSKVMQLNPLPFFLGKRMVVGDPESLFERGEDYTSGINMIRETDINGIVPLLKKYGIEYFFDSVSSPHIYGNAQQMNSFKVISMGNQWVLLQLVE